MRGVKARAGTPETDADPRNPNVSPIPCNLPIPPAGLNDPMRIALDRIDALERVLRVFVHAYDESSMGSIAVEKAAKAAHKLGIR